VVGSPGLSSGTNASGIVKVCRVRVVLNMIDTEPDAENASRFGRPIPTPAATVRLPATPEWARSAGLITTNRTPVTEP